MSIFISRPTRQGEIKNAVVDISEIHDVRWDNSSGNSRFKHPGYLLYGYINYARAVELGLSSGTHSKYGNGVKITIYEKNNQKISYVDDYNALLRQVGDKPKSRYNKSVSGKPLTKRILEELENGAKTRGELRDTLLAEKYTANQIMGALHRMKADGRIYYDIGGNTQKQLIHICNSV